MLTKPIHKRGVVILFAVLLVSVVLTISLGVFNITYRQIILSSVARESEFAFFAADSARNCALYWDSPGRAQTDRPFGYYSFDVDTGAWSFNPAATNNLNCGGAAVTVNPAVSTANTYSRTFSLPLVVGAAGQSRQACALVTVEKWWDFATAERRTTITASGYNIADQSQPSSCVPADMSRAVERTIIAESQG